MTATDLEAWRSHMGWSARQAYLALDISADRWRRMMEGGRIPTHIALACAALAEGLPAWRLPDAA